MKVVLDLPDWVDERHVRIKRNDGDVEIFAGIELVAIKKAELDHFLVKDGRCNMCGDCCTGLSDSHIYPIIDGDCIHLQPPDASGRRICGIPIARSRLCDNDPRPGVYERCSITYKKVKVKK